jgi:hypothetical protein
MLALNAAQIGCRHTVPQRFFGLGVLADAGPMDAGPLSTAFLEWEAMSGSVEPPR